jgi:hypothetical protein
VRILQRIGGWCEPVFERLWIAHPGAAVFDVKALEADAAAALHAGTFIEVVKGFRKAEPNFGWYREFVDSSRTQ